MKTKFKRSMFNTPVKSQRRAEIVSIKTPHEFRESIKELEKGNYTLADQRALILAQNRAKAMLNKKDLSDKERKEMTEISKIKIPKSNKILGEIGLVEEYTEKGEKPFMTI